MQDIIKNINYYEQLFENAHEPILLFDGNFFIDGNQAALNALKIPSKEELKTIHPKQISPKYQPDGELSLVKSNWMISLCFENGFHRFEWLHKTLDGKEIFAEVTLKTIRINHKRMIHATLRDMEAQKNYERKLSNITSKLIERNQFINKINIILQNTDNSKNDLIETVSSLEQYKQIINKSSIVSKTDTSGIITYANDKFCEVSGYTKEELIGKNHNIIKHPDTPKEFFTNLWNTILNKKVFKAVIKNKNKSGEAYYVDSIIIPILDKNEDIIEFIGIRYNLTSLFEKEKIIVEQFTDKLTALPNRQKLLKAIESQSLVKLALINIDSFKDINNSYGIDFGDNLLKNFARELLLFKRVNLHIYRVYGDIFAILAVGNFSYNEFLKTIDNIIKHFENLIFNINATKLNMTCTIGISIDQLKPLTTAEMALLHAKRKQKDFMIFDHKMPLCKELEKNIQLTKDIKHAISNDLILLFGQKIINNITSEIKYETLMRMQVEDGTIISPFKFLEHAKKAKLYPSLTKS